MAQNSRSYFQNTGSPDNTFNFGNQLDISNGKKDKTGEMFFKQAYDFDDFQNIGDDKTVKSSNYKTRKNTNSNILKRQQQFSHIGQFELSGTGFGTKKVLDESISKALSEKAKYPQFGQRKFSIEQSKRQAQYSTPNQVSVQGGRVNMMRGSQLSYTKTNIQPQDAPTIQNTASKLGLKGQNDMRVKYDDDYPQSFRKKQLPMDINKKQPTVDFKKKQGPNFKDQQLLTKQQQYKQLMSMINYYKGEAQRMSYQRTVMEEESIAQMISMGNSQYLEQQIVNHMEEINLLNRQIEHQRATEKKLTRVINELTQEYNQIVQSVEEMQFQRPPLIKDEAKALMDEINQLKRQFNNLQIDEGQLNLSCTIPQVGTLESIENRMGQSHLRNKQQNINHQQQLNQHSINALLEEIHDQNMHSEDPQLLKNLKLACLKDEWTIFSNKEIIVSLDYKSCPLIKMRIGNKTNQQLQKFSMQIHVQDIVINYMQNQTINKKAFLLEGIKVDTENLSDLFYRIRISYQINQLTPQMKSIRLYCPTGILNFGEFTPLTLKEFETEMSLPLPTLQSPLKPIDKTLISSIDEIMLYIPNLKQMSGQSDAIFGLFMSVFNEGSLVLVEQSLDLIRVKLKNGSKGLLKLLQFILTV